jgi:tetratricopeptide (TPR) repeat protein
MKLFHRLLCTAAALAIATFAQAAPADLDTDLAQIQQAWAHANYEVPAGDARTTALEQLCGRAEEFARRYPGRAEPLIWQGIVESTYAGAKGGFGALKYAKNALAHLNAALEIDPRALDGSAYTSIGTLYYKVPGFPLAFGDKDKARAYLEKALQMNPSGIDQNYFYAEYLYEQGDYRDALTHLDRAAHAPARPNRETADRGRHAEIDALAEKVRRKMA